MTDRLKARQRAALDEALQTARAADLNDTLQELGALGFATRSADIPPPPRRGRAITDYFGLQKGDLRTVALLPRGLWPEYRYEGTVGNAVWLCYCDACGRLATMVSYKLRPKSRARSCGCSGRTRDRGVEMHSRSGEGLGSAA